MNVKRNSVTQSTLMTNPMSAVAYVDSFIIDAVDRGASDIHIDPKNDSVKVALRRDGDLELLCEYMHCIHSEIVSRIKVLSRLKLDEHFIPQDGRFKATIGNHEIDLRVVVTPSYFGEAIVLRILRKYDDKNTLSTLGFSTDQVFKINNALKSHHGAILVCGPTGSGKTTTLYTILRETVRPERMIVTLEDPIEYIIPHARQIGIRSSYSFSFADALRSVLRQDPDVIMLGEIRDTETAKISMTAAMTGHLLLSSLHTKHASEVKNRLKNMGVDEYVLEPTISIIIAQRLVKKLCDKCWKERPLAINEIKFLESRGIKISAESSSTPTIYESKGCLNCENRGYVGRIVISEVMNADDLKNERKFSRKNTENVVSYKRLIEDGYEKATKGLIDFKELYAL